MRLAYKRWQSPHDISSVSNLATPMRWGYEDTCGNTCLTSFLVVCQRSSPWPSKLSERRNINLSASNVFRVHNLLTRRLKIELTARQKSVFHGVQLHYFSSGVTYLVPNSLVIKGSGGLDFIRFDAPDVERSLSNEMSQSAGTFWINVVGEVLYDETNWSSQ